MSSMDDITDDGLQALVRFVQLERLWLDDMASITSKGIEALGVLTELQWLSICGLSAAVKPESLNVFTKLPKLKTLYVDGTKREMEKLRTRLPKVVVCRP